MIREKEGNADLFCSSCFVGPRRLVRWRVISQRPGMSPPSAGRPFLVNVNFPQSWPPVTKPHTLQPRQNLFSVGHNGVRVCNVNLCWRVRLAGCSQIGKVRGDAWGNW